MPWKEASTMSLRLEFVSLAMHAGANIRSLCRRFGVSAPTAYKWLARYRADGVSALSDQSRRPKHSPRRTLDAMEEAVVALRSEHGWGGRKIRKRLEVLGYRNPPSPSTITAICYRHGLVQASPDPPAGPFQRFEAAAPNHLWQMDFMGDFELYHGRCYTLTVLDDHSRFSLRLAACANQQHETVRSHLEATFHRYGLPHRMLADNGGPWGTCGQDGYSKLAAWLMRLGITLSHSRVCHPQTLGKDERFHKTLRAELVSRRTFLDHADCQHHYDYWREIYNCQRPHESLNNDVPAEHYQPSIREMPKTLPPIEYAPSDIVRKVDQQGRISFHNRVFKIGRGFAGNAVALRATTYDGLFDVYFCHQHIDQINLKNDITTPQHV